MALAVCLLFDARTERLLRQLWGRLEARGVRTLRSHTHGRHYPHLSYAVLLDWDVDRVRSALVALPDEGPFSVSCHGTVVFPRGRAGLAPSVPAQVAVRQERLTAALLRTGAVLHHSYDPGMWVPHVSVATRAAGAVLPTVVKAISDVLPMTAYVERVALIDSATGQLWSLPHVP
ncbi:MAG: 2'-5' RNA ligase family protein [Dermatophilaceae bacterium]